MDTGRNDLLGEIAADAALERSDFLVQSTDQLRRFRPGILTVLRGLRRLGLDPFRGANYRLLFQRAESTGAGGGYLRPPS